MDVTGSSQKKKLFIFNDLRSSVDVCGNPWKGGVERVMGIEPTLFAWEARVLPLNDTRVCDEAATAAVFDTLTVPGCELGLSYIKAV